MKKKDLRLCALLLALLLLLTACGEYNPAVKDPGNHGHETDTAEGDHEPVTDAEGNVDKNPFTVTLKVDGEVYIPSE